MKHGLLKDKTPVEKTYFTRSINQKNNERLDNLCKDMLKYFEYKTQLNVNSMTFYLMINKQEIITLLDTQDVVIVASEDKKLLADMNTKAIILRDNFKRINVKPEKCEGLYCNYREVFENAMIDEKDELNNLYIMESDISKIFKIEYKSIILDLVERLKTLERVGRATGFGRQHV